MTVQFAMICYVNRSGSTLLSRLLSEWFEDAFVFPESSFLLHLLIDRLRGKILAGRELYDVVAADPRIDALGLSDRTLRSICDRSSTEDLAAFLLELAKASGGTDTIRVIVFKFETLIYLHDDIVKVFPGLKTIHLVRDPRAVIGSMMRSSLPEKPGFNMARNSIVFAANHWENYVRRVSEIGRTMPLLTIRFEDMGEQPEDVLDRLSGYLGLKAGASGTSDNRYHISRLDTALHAHVFQPFIEERSSGWKGELPTRSVAIIEALCEHGMHRFDYAPVAAKPSNLVMVRAYAAHLYWMLDHNLRTIFVYLRRKDGFKALSRRAMVYFQKY